MWSAFRTFRGDIKAMFFIEGDNFSIGAGQKVVLANCFILVGLNFSKLWAFAASLRFGYSFTYLNCKGASEALKWRVSDLSYTKCQLKIWAWILCSAFCYNSISFFLSIILHSDSSLRSFFHQSKFAFDFRNRMFFTLAGLGSRSSSSMLSL